MPNRVRTRRQLAWPLFARQIRDETEEIARNHGELLREQVLPMLRQAQEVVHTDPHLAERLLILAQRDIALATAAFADIRSAMVDAALGKDRRGEGAP